MYIYNWYYTYTVSRKLRLFIAEKNIEKKKYDLVNENV